MGVYLSKPNTEKYFQDGKGGRVRYGLASMQGWRTTMEDAVSYFLSPTLHPLLSVWFWDSAGFRLMGLGASPTGREFDLPVWNLCRVPLEFPGSDYIKPCRFAR